LMLDVDIEIGGVYSLSFAVRKTAKIVYKEVNVYVDDQRF